MQLSNFCAFCSPTGVTICPNIIDDIHDTILVFSMKMYVVRLGFILICANSVFLIVPMLLLYTALITRRRYKTRCNISGKLENRLSNRRLEFIENGKPFRNYT